MTRLASPILRLVAVAGLLLPLQLLAGELLESVQLTQLSSWFAQADRLSEPLPNIPVRLVKEGDRVIGAVFVSSDLNPIPAYSGKPIDTLIAIDSSTRIVGVKILRHEEPILVVGVSEQDLANFIAQYVNLHSLDKVRVNAQDRPGYQGIDGISGATITAMVLNRAIMSAAVTVSTQLGWPSQQAEVLVQPLVLHEPTLQERWDARVETWEGQEWKIAVISTGLIVLTGILFFQDWLVRRPTIFRPLRRAFQVYTVVLIGYWFSAQLSIVNVLAFMQTVTRGFTWDTLMIDAGIFLLWAYVAISILLWGRGVFCGWLCPFGAMQELLHDLAEKLRFPKLEFPPMIHERLWAIKYLILIVLVGISMDSFSTAAKLAEVEPFKTSLTLHFQREWTFVSYAILLLAISLFNSKFFCKYLCALGASLSILSRFRIFDWLRRRNECGSPCQSCAAKCQISAIRPTGEINDHECHYCLECQLIYWDDHHCPPLVEKRKRREKRQKKAEMIEVLELKNDSVQ